MTIPVVLQPDPQQPTALYRQLYLNLRDAILAGRLKRGARLPSTRELAVSLNISRNTVLNAFEQLLAEGYLETTPASGTFVSLHLPVDKPGQRPLADSRLTHWSKLARSFRSAPALHVGDRGSERSRAFRAGLPALDAFPFKLWGRLVARRARHLDRALLDYQTTAGYRPLREAIAAHVTVSRQVRCTADQIVIVSGSQGALDLVARLLVDPGDPVWLEDPGYLGARGAFAGAGARIVPVPVDAEGLRVEVGRQRCIDARLAYLTPSHQFPLGVTLSLQRRLELLDWARSANAYVVEDDYDSEYRFHGRPLAALQGLDETGRVIYVGTFSKTLFPSLRLGYLILPHGLLDTFLAAKAYTEVHAPALEQGALADFIADGHFGRHIRRMRALYGERREALLSALVGLPVEPFVADTGMHGIGWLQRGADDVAVTRAAAEHGVDVTPLSRFSLARNPRPGLLLGYACVDPARIKAGARRLAAALSG
ncbi:MAG TPA: PLP-dependent aminotransferase family protein [Anaerolineales bacterium]|nr:PLP-dependent aminotransferase family protein [Anaerolineales bacterium]